MEAQLEVKSSLHKLVESDRWGVATVEQVCRAGEVRQLLEEVKSSVL